MIKQNCYFNILDLDLEESTELMEESLTEYFDTRRYDAYLIQSVLSEESMSYDEYKSKCIEKGQQQIKVDLIDTETVQKENENILLDFINHQNKK